MCTFAYLSKKKYMCDVCGIGLGKNSQRSVHNFTEQILYLGIASVKHLVEYKFRTKNLNYCFLYNLRTIIFKLYCTTCFLVLFDLSQ